MARRYVMKVSELQSLANEQHKALANLCASAMQRSSEQFDAHLPYALREALGRLDVLDMMGESRELIERLNTLHDRIAEYLGMSVGDRQYRRYGPEWPEIDVLAQNYMRYNSPSTALTSMPDHLAEEVAQIMSERGVTVCVYNPPSPNQLLQEFKQCSSLQELKRVVTHHHAEALTALGPLLKKEEPSSV